MFEGWAAIVYGRTYHLDFRFITVPHDFSASDLTWASQHIVATTQQARNLAGSPRWSLFKNDSYCICGVTCTVKDLLGHTVKDDRGRPLYIFVGYVAHSDLALGSIPAYSAECLDNFKILYQSVEKVWSIKNYDLHSRKPSLSQYYTVDFDDSATDSIEEQLPQLNQLTQHPNQIYLWQSKTWQNRLLWQASAICPSPIATCLNISGKALINSPFLNQSSDRVEQFQILEREPIDKSQSFQTESHTIAQPNSFPQKLAHRAKEDIDLTLQQAAKMAMSSTSLAIASQELIDRLDWSGKEAVQDDDEPDTEADNFGFKIKKSTPPSQQDWF